MTDQVKDLRPIDEITALASTAILCPPAAKKTPLGPRDRRAATIPCGMGPRERLMEGWTPSRNQRGDADLIRGYHDPVPSPLALRGREEIGRPHRGRARGDREARG